MQGTDDRTTDHPAVSVAHASRQPVLLVKRGQAPSRGFYAFPGGRSRPARRWKQAARRELLEETGLAGGALSPLRRPHRRSSKATTRRTTTCRCSPALCRRRAACRRRRRRGRLLHLAEMEQLPTTDSVLEVAPRTAGGHKRTARASAGDRLSDESPCSADKLFRHKGLCGVPRLFLRFC